MGERRSVTIEQLNKMQKSECEINLTIHKGEFQGQLINTIAIIVWIFVKVFKINFFINFKILNFIISLISLY